MLSEAEKFKCSEEFLNKSLALIIKGARPSQMIQILSMIQFAIASKLIEGTIKEEEKE